MERKVHVLLGMMLGYAFCVLIMMIVHFWNEFSIFRDWKIPVHTCVRYIQNEALRFVEKGQN
jgi:hypothetical protein